MRERLGAIGGVCVVAGLVDARFALVGLSLMALAAPWRRTSRTPRSWGDLERLEGAFPDCRWTDHGHDLFSTPTWPRRWANFADTDPLATFSATVRRRGDGTLGLADVNGRLELIGRALTGQLREVLQDGDEVWLIEGWLGVTTVDERGPSVWRGWMEAAVEAVKETGHEARARVREARSNVEPVARLVSVMADPGLFERRSDPDGLLEALIRVADDPAMPRPTRLVAVRLLAGRRPAEEILAYLHRLVFLHGQREDQPLEERAVRGLQARDFDARIAFIRVLEEVGTLRALKPLEQLSSLADEQKTAIEAARVAIRRRFPVQPKAGSLSFSEELPGGLALASDDEGPEGGISRYE